MHGSFALVVASLLLGGCATLFAEKECLDGNWYEVGYRDGGDDRRSADYWRNVCGTWKLGVDGEAYERGHRDGVSRVYCTPEKAFAEGRAGQLFNLQSCGGRADLRARHEAGLREFCVPAVAYEAGGRLAGYPFDRCGRAAADLKRAYQDGVTRVYCRPANAYRAGRDDKSFQLAQCPPGSESAYRTGLDVRGLTASIAEIDSELGDLRRKRDDKDIKEREKHQVESRIRSLEREQRRNKEKLEALERAARDY